jgi:hypothetical protein
MNKYFFLFLVFVSPNTAFADFPYLRCLDRNVVFWESIFIALRWSGGFDSADSFRAAVIAASLCSVPHLVYLASSNTLKKSNYTCVGAFLVGVVYTTQLYFIEYTELIPSPILLKTTVFAILFGLFLVLILKFGFEQYQLKEDSNKVTHYE